MMPITDYIGWARGKKLDMDGVPTDQPYQCVDLIKYAMEKCYGIKNFTFTTKSNPHGYAKGLFENFDEYPQLKGKFVKIKNTPSFVPQVGDIVEWGYYKGVTGQAGHTALAEGENIGTSKFVSLDQNWGKQYFCTDVTHNYKGVLGVIRPLLKCTTANLNVRKGPGKTYEIVDVLDRGTLVKPLTYKNGWAKLGEDRWVCADYIE